MRFLYSLCSSSSGNASYIGSNKSGILIDAGLSLRALSRALAFNGIEKNAIKAIFITHEHSDHIKGLKNIAKALDVPVFATARTLSCLIHKELITNSLATELSGGSVTSVELEGMTVSAFKTPHDSVDSTGYKIVCEDGKTISICTDLGHITETVYQSLKGSDLVFLESNYDDYMLQSGGYPLFLKRRISSDSGHLSNACCAEAIVDLFNDGTTKFMLGHLSENNNRPELAFKATLEALLKTGGELERDFTLTIARKQTIGELVEI